MVLVTQLAPIFLLFGLGILLRRTGFMAQEQAGFLLKMVFFVTLPALVLSKVSLLEFDPGNLRLALLAVLLLLCAWPLARWLADRAPGLERTSRGSVILSCMIPNNAFIIPFALWGLGDEAFAYVMLFDAGLAIIVSSLAYGLGFHYSDAEVAPRAIADRILRAPVLWAVLLALLLSAFGAGLPGWAQGFLNPLGSMTGPLLLIALGVFFSPQPMSRQLLIGVLALRMLGGGALGLALGLILGLSDMMLLVAILCCSAPIGFNALTFSTLAGLDTRLTANMVSFALLVALVYIPALIFLLPRMLL
jgi:predicted permease